MAQPSLEIVNAHARYAERTGSARAAAEVLRGVSLEASAGEIVALLGPNGAGKSTLLRVASGILAPVEGSVRLMGKPVDSLDRRALARIVAVVGQAEAPASGFSVRQVVMMGRAPHQGSWMVSREEDVAIVDDALARCDLRAIADRPAEELSGGEQKRVSIARALAQRPRVLLLDEPSAFLDARHQVELYDLLSEEVRRGELACVVVMHDLNVASQYASRVALMKDGRIVAAGTIEEVMTYRRLRETFDVELYCGENEVNGTRYFIPMRARRAP